MRSVTLLEIVHESPTVTIATHASLIVLAFHAEVDHASLVEAERVQAKLLPGCPNGTLVLTVIAHDVPLPAEGTRAMVVDCFKRMAARNSAAATTVIGDGFWASAMRSTLTALNLVVRPPCPQKTFASVGEALSWLASFDGALSAPGLAREVNSLRERLPAKASGDASAGW